MRPVFADPKMEECEARERDRIARQYARGALAWAHRLGLERGRREGKAEGKAAGEAAGKAGAVLAVLAARGLVLTEEQRTKITSEVDLATLERWLLVALKAERADELWAASS